MEAGVFFNLLVNGLMTGGIYALIAAGFTLILGVIQVFNFAQGHFFVLGAYIAFALVSALGSPYPIAVLAALVAMALLGVLLYFGIIHHTIPHGFFHTLLVTVLFGTIVTQTSIITFGFYPAVLAPVIPGELVIGGVVVSRGKLLVIACAIPAMVALYYFMKTKIGTAILATAENRDAASLQGINAKQIFWVTTAVGCGLTGLAGGIILPVLSVSPLMAPEVFVRALLVVLIGGMGSMSGALIAAFLIGIVESFAFQLTGELSLAIVFVVMTILVFFRPGGLLGRPMVIPGD